MQLDIGPAGSLAASTAASPPFLAAASLPVTYEGLNLRCREVGVDSNNRQLGAADELRRSIRLQRRDNNAVIAAGAEVGLDHVLHFVERCLRAWPLTSTVTLSECSEA